MIIENDFFQAKNEISSIAIRNLTIDGNTILQNANLLEI